MKRYTLCKIMYSTFWLIDTIMMVSLGYDMTDWQLWVSWLCVFGAYVCGDVGRRNDV